MKPVTYQLDGKLVAEHRRRRARVEPSVSNQSKSGSTAPELAWRQEDLARNAGISIRVVNDIENNIRAVSKDVATRVANALGVSLKSLTAKFDCGTGLTWQEIPDLPFELRPRLLAAMELDMEGNHQEAALICEAILPELPKDDDDNRAAVTIKQATFLDHGKENRAAIQLLDDLLEWSRGRSELSPDMVMWAHYHVAISYRRLGEFAIAEEKLEPVLTSAEEKFKMAARLQLGILYLKRVRNGEEHLAQPARELFEQTRRYWHRDGNHREAFSLRRLGQLHAWEGSFKKAIEAFFQAATICAANGCTRYVELIAEDLEKFVYPRMALHVNGHDPVQPVTNGLQVAAAGETQRIDKRTYLHD